MAYDLKAVGNFGDGHLGDYIIADGVFNQCNTSARVTNINANIITVDLENAQVGAFETFAAGNDILIHVSASTGATEKLGRYVVAKITLTNLNVLTLDKDVSGVIDANDLTLNYYVQAITIANFDCLTLDEGAILAPQPYDPFKYVGGILAFRCYNDLKLRGGVIDLTESGIPANYQEKLRPLTTQETAANGESDFAKYSGQENYITAERLLLNAGDGAAFIVAKNFDADDTSRIGNPSTHGASYCRGASNSAGVLPSNITNIGGSTILIAAENIKKFSPKLIAKYRDASLTRGKGLCRCLIASNSKLPLDEGLYSYDVLSDDLRLRRVIGIHDFGNGSFGELENPLMPLNNYAQVTLIKDGGLKVAYINKTFNGLAPLTEGSLILAQVIQKTAKDTSKAGLITTARVISDSGTEFTLDFPVAQIDLNKYNLQIISMPQFSNFRISGNYNFTRKYNNGLGGTMAVAVKDVFDLRGGKINVEGKGGAIAYGENGLKTIGNAQMFDSLPIGAGHGAVFIMARQLQVDDNSRIGALYSGANAGDRFGGGSGGGTLGGGYRGAVDLAADGSGGGFIRGGNSSDGLPGGFASNGVDIDNNRGGYQGAHIFIVADVIEGYNAAVISTGGEGGIGLSNGISGSAGYGGGGAVNGSSGGSSGFAFVYCNEVV